MRVLVTMPSNWGRSYLGKGKFVKSAPVFKVAAFDNNGNRINDRFPSEVPFGPGMYDLLYKLLPSVASNLKEDITYEGYVPKRTKSKEKYAYYGYGNTPDNGGVKENPQGIGIIGYGDTELPKNMAEFGYDYAGNPNYKYSELMDVAPNFSDRNSEVLTNILNESRDFSPLLAPLYPYADPTYDPRINDEKIPLKERMKYARDVMAKRRGLEAFDYDPTSVEGNSANGMSVTDAGKVFVDPDTHGLSFPITSTALLDNGEGRSAGMSNMAPKAIISGVSPKTAGDGKTVYGKRNNTVGRFGDLNKEVDSSKLFAGDMIPVVDRRTGRVIYNLDGSPKLVHANDLPEGAFTDALKSNAKKHVDAGHAVYSVKPTVEDSHSESSVVDIPDEDVIKFMSTYSASPTDHWVPRIDPVTHEVIRDENGEMKKMPVPLTMGMPIYNFNHPMWQRDPEAAWNMIDSFESAMDFDKYGIAPKFADYKGNISATEGGKARVMDYPLTIRKQAETEGYFPEFDLGGNHNKLRDVMDARKQEGRKAAREAIADESHKETLRERFRKQHETEARKQAVDKFAPDDKSLKHGDGSSMSRDEIRKRYRSMVHNYFRDTDKSELNKLGLDTDEEKAVQQYVTNTANTKAKGDSDILTKYNALPENEKMAAIVKDYVQWRTDSNRGKAEEKKAAATSEDKRAREQDKADRFRNSYAARQHENKEREYGELFDRDEAERKKIHVIKKNGDVDTLTDKKAEVGRTGSQINRFKSDYTRTLGGQPSAGMTRLNPTLIDAIQGPKFDGDDR